SIPLNLRDKNMSIETRMTQIRRINTDYIPLAQITSNQCPFNSLKSAGQKNDVDRNADDTDTADNTD
ncbi:MAG: hypothetical protein ABIT58_07435, partial [Ferruginibacter sp.]